MCTTERELSVKILLEIWLPQWTDLALHLNI